MANKLVSGIENLIPSYIVEQYPNFVLFLRGYYEWLSQTGNPKDVLDNHLSRMAFDQSLDEYTTLLKQKYLRSIPEDTLADKARLIHLSKKFFLSKGSLYSYKFLFNVLFKSSAEIYLPKNDVFRLSDGKWIDEESVMFVTPVTGVSDTAFAYKRIKQTRQVYKSVYEYAYASVQRVVKRQYGGYNLTELYISDVKGEFKAGYPIENDDGDIAWLIPIASSYTINNGGVNFQDDDVLQGDIPQTYTLEFTVGQEDVDNRSVDTHISTFYSSQSMVFTLNDIVITPEYDGQNVVYDYQLNDVLKVTFPTHKGLITVGTAVSGEITSVNILDPIIGNFDQVTMSSSLQSGEGADVSLGFNVVSPRVGHYTNNDSQLSTDRYLQDSYFYQEYSYVLRTEVDIDRYRDILKQTVHPAGMKLFGMVSLYDLFKLVTSVYSEEIKVMPGIRNYMVKYSQGANLSTIDRLKSTLDPAVFRVSAIDEIPVKFWIGSENYKLYDNKLIVRNLFGDAQRQDVSGQYGWMTSHNFADTDITFGQSQVYVFNWYVDDQDNYITPDHTLESYIIPNYYDENYI